MLPIPYESHYLNTNGIQLHTIQAGPTDGPLIVLLHGFPEFWYAWRKQIPFLVNLGYRVVAVDQRGYNLSDKPSEIRAYTLDELAADIFGILPALGREKMILVGHDWGGAVSWWFASKYPEVLEKLIVLNIPHHAIMKRTLLGSFKQKFRSSYMFFFQIPKLPEYLLSLGNYSIFATVLKKSSLPKTYSAEELLQYRKAWSQPKAIFSMLAWYRALVKAPSKRPENRRISVPTLLIWGKQDLFLGSEMAQPSIDLCDRGFLRFIPKATHWVQHEQPDQVNSLINTFLKATAI